MRVCERQGRRSPGTAPCPPAATHALDERRLRHRRLREGVPGLHAPLELTPVTQDWERPLRLSLSPPRNTLKSRVKDVRAKVCEWLPQTCGLQSAREHKPKSLFTDSRTVSRRCPVLSGSGREETSQGLARRRRSRPGNRRHVIAASAAAFA